MADKGLKRAALIGAIAGAALTLGIAFSMDFFLSGAFQGTWWDAAARDVTRTFGPACGRNPVAILLMLVTVMGFLAAFGALLGAAAGIAMNRFFKVILKI